MYWSVCILFNDLPLPNFSGNIIFYIPLNVLCSATERNVDCHYRNGSFWKSKPWSLPRQPCWNLLCWLTLKKRSPSLSLSLPIKSGAQRTLSGGFMAAIYLSGGAAKTYEVSLGAVRFCFLCLALLVFSLLLQSAYNFPLFIFIGI